MFCYSGTLLPQAQSLNRLCHRKGTPFGRRLRPYRQEHLPAGARWEVGRNYSAVPFPHVATPTLPHTGTEENPGLLRCPPRTADYKQH